MGAAGVWLAATRYARQAVKYLYVTVPSSIVLLRGLRSCSCILAWPLATSASARV
jgi:hypothetical protein